MEIPAEFTECLARQRAAYRANPVPSAQQRRNDLEALRQLLKDNETDIVSAIHADFGVRSAVETQLMELFPVREGIRSTIANLGAWMRPQKRSIDWLVFPGAKNRVIPQPLGVVGVIVPWNFPIQLSFGPLVDLMAAGNHAMIKMSENSGQLARLLIERSTRYLPIEKLAFFECGGRGPAFSSLPFDHLIFTGSSATGRSVMASAAANLCPVTLELGGKAPAVVAPDFPIITAAERILWAVIDGDRVLLKYVRNFDYRTADDFAVRYEEREVLLSHLTSVDFYISYWMPGPVAHTFVSFNFDNARPVCISIEARPEPGRGFEPIPSMFKQFGLIYVVADERDVVRVRTNIRHEDVYLYRIVTSTENARQLFLIYLDRINELADRPEFYHLLSNSCTLNIVRYARIVGKPANFDIRFLVNGYSDRALYRAGFLYPTLPFDELRRRSHINAAAQAADDAPDFSQRIREGLPLMQP